jgi:acetyl esterase/lipase
MGRGAPNGHRSDAPLEQGVAASLRLLARLPAALLAALAAGCSPIAAVNALVPKSGYGVVEAVPYGNGPRHKLDLYIPTDAAAAPVVVFFYGGGWKSGVREDYRFAAEAFASAGFLTVVPDYRLHPEVSFPAFVEDGAAAIAWVTRNIAAHGGDSGRIYLVGHSAGAHIAALLALDGRFLAAEGVDRQAIRGAVGMAGPYDFLPIREKYWGIFGADPRHWPETQPIHFVDGREPPMFLLAGESDTTVDPGNVRRLATRIRATGGTVDTKLYPNIGHVFLVGMLAAPLSGAASVRADVIAWLKAH